MPAFRDTYEDVLNPVAWADLLVSHVLTYAMPVLAEKFTKPWASTVLSPMVFLSVHEVPVLAPLPIPAKLGRSARNSIVGSWGSSKESPASGVGPLPSRTAN